MTNVLRPLPVDEFVRLAEHSGLEVNRDDLDNLARRRLIQPYETGSYSRLHLYMLAIYFDAIRVFRHPWSLRSSGRTLDAVKELSESVLRVAVDLEKDEYVEGLGADVAQLALDIERFIATVDPFGPIADVIDVVRADVLHKLRGSGRLYAELRATASALAAASEDLEGRDARGPRTREVPEDVLKETAEQYPLGDLSDLTDGFDDEDGFEALDVRGPLTREIQLSGAEDDDEEEDGEAGDELSDPEAVELDLDSEADETGEMATAEEPAEEPEPEDADDSDEADGDLEEESEEEEEEEASDEDDEAEADGEEAADEEESDEEDASDDDDSDPEDDEALEEVSDVEDLDAEDSDAEDSDAEDSDAEDSDAEDSDAENSDAEDSDAEDSDAEDSDAEDSDAEDSDVEDSDVEDSDAEDSDAADSEAEDEDEDETDEDQAAAAESESDVEELEDDDFVADDTGLMESDAGDSDEDLRTTLETESVKKDTNGADNPFSREDSMSRTGRTKALLDRLEEIKAQKEDGPDGAPADASLEEKVNELNQKREQLIRAQDWAGLVTLYETRIDLFEEPGDRQQVFLTLATLYELKLADHKSAFEAFSAAFGIDVRAGRIKTLDSLRKIGRRDDVVARYVTWLEEHLAVSGDDEMRHMMQRDLGEAHRAAGHPQRAFLSYAAYIAEDPERATPDALDFLDELSISVGDDELAGFYDDILDHEASAETRALIGHRAGMFFQSCNRPADAIRSFRVAFDADPTSELAYSNLSRLYEKQEAWADFRSLIAEKLKAAEGDEATRLRKELSRIVAQETSTAGAVEQFAQTLENDPNDDTALERLVSGYAAQNKFTDAYAHLNRLLDKDTDAAQEVRIRRHLAELAMNHLESPEEASHHLETALDLVGPEREILELLANVRLSAGEWGEAISTVRMLTGGAVMLPQASLRKWLNAGIEAARMAERPDDMRHFQEHLQRESGGA